MTITVVLAGYAVVLATAGAWALARAGWVDRAPRLAIAAWQALSASVLLAVLFAGLALTVPSVRVSGSLADLLAACVMALRAQYATPAGAAAGAVGVVVVVALVGRLSSCLVIEFARAARWRKHHRAAVDMVGRRDMELDAVVVDHSTPAAYCMPGWRRRIVLTTAALAALEPEQLAAVLAHERAHLRGRHHLVSAAALGLAKAFPNVPAFRLAGQEVVRLVELVADDDATQAVDRLTLAEALLQLGTITTSPARVTASLAAGGSGAAARVRRLIGPQGPLGRAATALALAGIALAVTAPVAVAAVPAAATTHTQCCPGELAGTAVGASRMAARTVSSGPCVPHKPPGCTAAICPARRY